MKWLDLGPINMKCQTRLERSSLACLITIFQYSTVNFLVTPFYTKISDIFYYLIRIYDRLAFLWACPDPYNSDIGLGMDQYMYYIEPRIYDKYYLK